MSSDPKSPPIQNPRYQGATPEDVARALLKKWGSLPDDDESDPETEMEAA